MNSSTYVLLTSLLFANNVLSNTDWSSQATLPGNKKCKEIHGHLKCYKDQNRENIWNLNEESLEESIDNGARHSLYYPVEITPLTIPLRSLETAFNQEHNSPIRRFIFKLSKKYSKLKSIDDIYNWLGLNAYPKTPDEVGINPIPYMEHLEKDPMGVTIRDEKITFSCATCHSADLFGTKVLGMTNRFTRANEFFISGQRAMKNTPKIFYKQLMKPTAHEYAIFLKTKESVNHVGLKKPLALGLDTSLAQVGLSLAKRNQDEYATFNKWLERFPRNNKLTKVAADSKPAVWWNLKYKTRWLSDGSIVSGNPIYTNFLWNEIGRGIDLKELENWLINNNETIKDLTAYVFATNAPRYNRYFPNQIDIDLAKKGQKLYLKNCSGCHGEYEKGWDQNADTYDMQIATTKVWYHEQTPVIDVGTDSHRYEGMQYFAEDLNRLKISKTIGTVVKAQKGYVPPPLVGIWARWPYFHNNSVPTLYDVISPDFERPKTYVAVAAMDKQLDFDSVKNGYPQPHLIREAFRKDKNFYFDTKIKGLSNMGHTKMLLDKQGTPKFSHDDKLSIIEFLKTL